MNFQVYIGQRKKTDHDYSDRIIAEHTDAFSLYVDGNFVMAREASGGDYMENCSQVGYNIANKIKEFLAVNKSGIESLEIINGMRSRGHFEKKSGAGQPIFPPLSKTLCHEMPKDGADEFKRTIDLLLKAEFSQE